MVRAGALSTATAALCCRAAGLHPHAACTRSWLGGLPEPVFTKVVNTGSALPPPLRPQVGMFPRVKASGVGHSWFKEMFCESQGACWGWLA